MPVSQGSGGYMPGMTLRAWAVVSAAGALVKSSVNVSGAAKIVTGKYSITLSDGAASANGVLKGTVQYGVVSTPRFVCMDSAPVGNVVTFIAPSASGALNDVVSHVELWE